MERANTNKQRDGMALSASRLRPSRTDNSDPDPIVTDLPLLADDPEIIRLTERKNMLRRAYAARDALLQVRSIDNEFKRGTGSQHGPRADLLRGRRVALLASLPAPTEAKPAPDDIGLHPDVVAAMRLVRGEKFPAPADDAAETARLTEEMNLIDTAMRQVDAELDEVRADRSAEVARSLWVQHCGILLSKLNAALALSAAASAERQLVASMIAAGYTTQPGILLSPRLDAAEVLGNPARLDSPIARFRAALEVANVL